MRFTSLTTVRALARRLISDHESVDSHPRYQTRNQKGAPGGYPNLDLTGKVPSSQLPASGGGLTAAQVACRVALRI